MTQVKIDPGQISKNEILQKNCLLERNSMVYSLRQPEKEVDYTVHLSSLPTVSDFDVRRLRGIRHTSGWDSSGGPS